MSKTSDLKARAMELWGEYFPGEPEERDLAPIIEALRAAYDAGIKADPVARQLVAAESYAEGLELLLRRCLDVLPVSGRLYSDIADAINGPECPERSPAISALRSTTGEGKS